MVANLFGNAEVGAVVGAELVGVHGVGHIALDHEVAEVVKECGVIVFSPQKTFCKGYLLVGVVPCGVVFWIDGNVLVLRISVEGRTRIVSLAVECDATHSTIQLAEGSAIAVERSFQAQGHDEAYLGNMCGNGGIEVQRLRDGTIGYRCDG